MTSEIRLPWSVYRYKLEGDELAGKVGVVVGEMTGRRPIGKDKYLHRLRKTHAPDVYGLVALKCAWRGREATVITAPGKFFKDPDLRFQLDLLKAKACEAGRFTLLIERRTFLKRLSPVPAAPPPSAHIGGFAVYDSVVRH